MLETAIAVKSALEKRGHWIELVNLDPSRIEDLCRFEWIFNLSETIYGFPLAGCEIAELMESLGIHFTGAGSESIKICENKAAAKIIISKYGVRTPLFEVFSQDDRIETGLAFPLIVKPLHEDGSIGITFDSVVGYGQEMVSKVSEIHRLY